MKRARPLKRKPKPQESKRPEPDAADPRSMDDDPVVQGILTAISQKRLKPGAKLGEDKLASAFGTTRIHIRQALAHLASRKVVMQFPNRGAFVYRPTWEEAQEIFAIVVSQRNRRNSYVGWLKIKIFAVNTFRCDGKHLRNRERRRKCQGEKQRGPVDPLQKPFPKVKAGPEATHGASSVLH